MSDAAPRRLLFVCTGNTCRSPLARFLAERQAREAGLPWSASSAGIAAVPDLPLSPGAVRALASRGVTGVTHRARLVTEAMLAEADAVYALSPEHRDALVARFPAHAAKVAVLREAAGLSPAGIEDPLGDSEEVYEQCAVRIDEALKILIRRTPHAQDAR
jgi:protein-tyrosine-phosphatase